MKHAFSRFFLSALVLFLPVGALASASSVAEILDVSGNREVTRAEFLKASVIVLGLSVDFDVSERKYRPYDEDIRPYVRAADQAQALDAFPRNADLSQSITRGEALRLVAELRTWEGTGAVLPFRDVDASSTLGEAVRLSAQRGWLRPLRNRVFGVNAPLRGKEARQLLTRAEADREAARGVKTIIVIPRRADPIDFNSKKFRDQIQTLLRDEYLYTEKLSAASGSTAKEYVASVHDPYTSLFDPTEAKEFRDQLSGTLTGIGVHLDDEHLEIISVIEGSPAERHGLKAGDRIITVNKKPVERMSFEETINRIRGKVGTTVVIGVLREGEELSFDIVRAEIDIPDSRFEMRSNVAIVTITQFGDHLLKDARQLFERVVASNPEGIVIDMRYNPGGYLQAVPSVLSEMLPRGSTYLITRGRGFNERYETDAEPSIDRNIPIMVLVNGGTASSAEIVAGALQDHGRATVIGTKTYGKGTVQTVVPFSNKSSLKFTIAEWLTPDGHPINDIGITPDIVVEQSDAGDAQLERALEFIRQRSR